MADFSKLTDGSDAIEQAAAAWVIRHENGLSAVEKEELKLWAAADPRHQACFTEHQTAWRRFAPLAEKTIARDEMTSLPPRRFSVVSLFNPVVLAAAAALAVGFFLWTSRSVEETVSPGLDASVSLPALLEERVLEDGSEVLLNRDALISVSSCAEKLISRSQRIRPVHSS